VKVKRSGHEHMHDDFSRRFRRKQLGRISSDVS
jgi:hypothetical protein